MSEFDHLQDHDQRQREYPDSVYFLVAVLGVGRIVCYRPGLALIDFYRRTHVLASAEQPQPKEDNESG